MRISDWSSDVCSSDLKKPAPERSRKMTQLLAIFATVFLAELGDKTQLATLLFAAGRETPPVMVFLAAAAALVLSTAVAVVLGVTAERYLAMVPLTPIAGIGFVALGLWTLWEIGSASCRERVCPFV